MKPVSFPLANLNLQPPQGMADCEPLPVCASNGTMTSVWEPTDEERAAIAAGASVALTVWGTAHPPVGLGVTEPCEPSS